MGYIKTFSEFINENRLGNHYGKNNLNKHLGFALRKILNFCEENNLVFQTVGEYCCGLKFDHINIFKDGTTNIGISDCGARKECIARIYADESGNVIYWCNGVEYKSCSELFDAVLKCRDGKFINESFNKDYDVDEIYNDLIDFYEPWEKDSEGITIEDYGEEGKAIKIPLTTNGDYAVTEPDAMEPSKIYCIDIPKKFEKCVNGPGLHQYDIEDLDPDQLPEGSEPMCRVLYDDDLQFEDIMDIVNKILNVMNPNEYKAVLRGSHTHIIR